MDLNAQKEQFSTAFVMAAAAISGYAISKPVPDEDSVDWTFAMRGGNGTVRSPKLDAQLKCTDQLISCGADLSYSLPVKNYSELIHSDYSVPRILIVVVVPKD